IQAGAHPVSQSPASGVRPLPVTSDNPGSHGLVPMLKPRCPLWVRSGHSVMSRIRNLVGGYKQHRWHCHPELLVCRRRLTNSFFLKDRCSLSNQICFILASNWRAFILAIRDRDRANKNEIETFVFSVTLNDFPRDMLLLERGCRAVRMPHVACRFARS